jgi:hypothetical protein
MHQPQIHGGGRARPGDGQGSSDRQRHDPSLNGSAHLSSSCRVFDPAYFPSPDYSKKRF